MYTAFVQQFTCFGNINSKEQLALHSKILEQDACLGTITKVAPAFQKWVHMHQLSTFQLGSVQFVHMLDSHIMNLYDLYELV